MARTPSWRRRPLLGLVLLLVLVAAAYLAGVGSEGQPPVSPSALTPTTAPGTAPGTPSGTTAAPSSAAVTDPGSGLPVLSPGELPTEARDTLALIASGGPYPYERDGAEFMNREGLLPRQPQGWYREYTVPTPGELDRGARRIVTGQDGTAYFTADHYDSFVVIGDP